MPRYVYGDSYGGVAQNELGLDAARDARYFQSLADQRARQAAADNMYLQQQAMANQRAQQQDAMAQAWAQHLDDLAQRNASLNQNKDLFLAQLENQKAMARLANIDRQNAYDQGQRSNAYNEVYQAINNGNVSTPTDVQALAGSRLGPDEMGRLMMYLDSAALRKQHAYEQAQQAADAYNQKYTSTMQPFLVPAQAAQKAIDTAPLAADKHWYNPATWFATSKEDLMAGPEPMPLRNLHKAQEDFSNAFLKDKNAQRLISYDAMGGKFVPMLSAPEYVPHQAAQPRIMPVTGSSAPTISAMPLMGGSNTNAPVSNAQWQRVPGTNVELSPTAITNILTQVSQIPDGPQRTLMSRKLTQQAIESGEGRQVPPAPPVPISDPRAVDSWVKSPWSVLDM